MGKILFLIWALSGAIYYFVKNHRKKDYFNLLLFLIAVFFGPLAFIAYKELKSRKEKPSDYHFITLLSGRVLNLYNPLPTGIDIEDIARSLSHLCRYNGHVKRFYSVCTHSLYVHDTAFAENPYLTKKERLQFLLHDATEPYVGDMVKPLKVGMPQFTIAEDRVWKAICEKFGMPEERHPLLKHYDIKALVSEMEVLTYARASPIWSMGIKPSTLPLVTETIAESRERFLALYEELTK